MEEEKSISLTFGDQVSITTTEGEGFLALGQGDIPCVKLERENDCFFRIHPHQEKSGQLGKVRILFGMVVQLQHRTSKFLASVDEVSTELTFEKESSRRCWFKIMPSSPDLSEGDPVVSGSGVLFEHQLSECALVVSDFLLSSGLSQVALRPFLSESDAMEGTNAFNIPPWTILYNDSLTNKQGVVSKGSYVRFIDQEAGLLKAPSVFEAKGQTKGQEVVRARLYQNPNDGLLEYSTIWKIEEDEEVMTTFGSGDIHWNKPVKIKSYETGKYLYIRNEKRDEEGDEMKKSLGLKSKGTSGRINAFSKFQSKAKILSAKGLASSKDKDDLLEAEIEALGEVSNLTEYSSHYISLTEHSHEATRFKFVPVSTETRKTAEDEIFFGTSAIIELADSPYTVHCSDDLAYSVGNGETESDIIIYGQEKRQDSDAFCIQKVHQSHITEYERVFQSELVSSSRMESIEVKEERKRSAVEDEKGKSILTILRECNVFLTKGKTPKKVTGDDLYEVLRLTLREMRQKLGQSGPVDELLQYLFGNRLILKELVEIAQHVDTDTHLRNSMVIHKLFERIIYQNTKNCLNLYHCYKLPRISKKIKDDGDFLVVGQDGKTREIAFSFANVIVPMYTSSLDLILSLDAQFITQILEYFQYTKDKQFIQILRQFTKHNTSELPSNQLLILESLRHLPDLPYMRYVSDNEIWLHRGDARTKLTMDTIVDNVQKLRSLPQSVTARGTKAILAHEGLEPNLREYIESLNIMTQMLYLYADIIYKNEHALAVFFKKNATHTKPRKSTVDVGEERLYIHEHLNFAIIKLAASDKLFRSYFEPNIIDFASACCYFEVMSRQVQLRSSARHVWALEQEAREEKIKHTLEDLMENVDIAIAELYHDWIDNLSNTQHVSYTRDENVILLAKAVMHNTHKERDKTPFKTNALIMQAKNYLKSSPATVITFCEQIFMLFSVYFVNNKYPGYERMVIRWCVTLLNMLHNERKWELYLPRDTDEKDDHVMKLLDNSIVTYLDNAMNCIEKFYDMVMAKQCFESLKVYSLKEKSHIPMAAVDSRTKELLEIRKSMAEKQYVLNELLKTLTDDYIDNTSLDDHLEQCCKFEASVKNGVTDVRQFGVLDGLMGQIILRQGGGAKDQAFLLRILSLVKHTMVLRSREINLFFALKDLTFVNGEELKQYLELRDITQLIDDDQLQRLLIEQTTKLRNKPQGNEKIRYQNLLRDSGLHSIVLERLKTAVDTLLEDDLVFVYITFLVQFVKENRANKSVVYKSIDYIYFMLNKAMKQLTRHKRSLRESRFDKLKDDSGIAKRIFLLGKLLREVYYQSPSFCHDVTEKKALIFLNQLLDTSCIWVRENGIEVNYIYKINVIFLDILYLLMNPFKDDIFHFIKANQNLLITTMNSSEQIKSVFLSKTVFQKGNLEEQQRYVLFIVLLGYCCGGKNYFPERALQKHFPLAEAFSLARGYNVPDVVELRDAFYAFLAFVYETYLNVESEMLPKTIAEFKNSSDFWSLLAKRSLTVKILEETADRLNINANIEHAFQAVDSEKMEDFVATLKEQLMVEINVNLNDIPIIEKSFSKWMERNGNEPIKAKINQYIAIMKDNFDVNGWGPIQRVIAQVEELTLQNYTKQIENTLVNHLLDWAEGNDGKYESIAAKSREVIRKYLSMGRLTLAAKLEELICPYVLAFKGQSLFKTKTVVFDIILPLISAFFQKCSAPQCKDRRDVLYYLLNCIYNLRESLKKVTRYDRNVYKGGRSSSHNVMVAMIAVYNCIEEPSKLNHKLDVICPINEIEKLLGSNERELEMQHFAKPKPLHFDSLELEIQYRDLKQKISERMYEDLVVRYFFLAKPSETLEEAREKEVKEVKEGKEGKEIKEAKKEKRMWNYLYYEPDYLAIFVRMIETPNVNERLLVKSLKLLRAYLNTEQSFDDEIMDPLLHKLQLLGLPDNILPLLNMKNKAVLRLVINILHLMLARDYNFTEEKFDANARSDSNATPLKLTNKFFDCFNANSDFFENVFNILTSVNKSVSKYKVRYDSEMRNYHYSDSLSSPWNTIYTFYHIPQLSEQTIAVLTLLARKLSSASQGDFQEFIDSSHRHLVKELVILIQNIESLIIQNNINLSFPISIFECLTEVIGKHRGLLLCLVRWGILRPINRILMHPFEKEDQQGCSMDLELKSVELKHLVTLFLLCLVENTSKDYDFRDIIISIDPEVFVRNTKVLVTPSTIPPDHLHTEVLAELAAKSLQIIKVLCSKNAFNANLKLKKKYLQCLQQCQAYCAHQVAFIEVQQEDPNSVELDTIYFPIPKDYDDNYIQHSFISRSKEWLYLKFAFPIVNTFFPTKIKAHLSPSGGLHAHSLITESLSNDLESHLRASQFSWERQGAKMSTFVKWVEKRIIQREETKRLIRAKDERPEESTSARIIKRIRFESVEIFTPLLDLSFLIAVVINVILLATIDNTTTMTPVPKIWYTLYGLCGFLLVLALCIFFLWLVQNANFLNRQRWLNKITDKNYMLFPWPEVMKHAKEASFPKKIAQRPILSQVLVMFYSLLHVIINPSAFFYLLYIAFAVVGLATSSRLWFCFHLFQIVMRVNVLKEAMVAVLKNAPQLLLVLLFLMEVVYAFTIISYLFFQTRYSDTNACLSLWQCFVTNTLQGVTSGGQLYQLVGTTIDVDPWSGLVTADTIAWTFYLMFFYVFVTIFCLNVVFAIIVDTFGKLRENRMKARDELDNSCFICSIERDTFIHSAQDFGSHVLGEHNPLHYLYYFAYLKDKFERYKKLTNRREAWIFKTMKAKNYLQIFPNSAGVLDANESDESKSSRKIHSKLAKLEKKLTNISGEQNETIKKLKEEYSFITDSLNQMKKFDSDGRHED